MLRWLMKKMCHEEHDVYTKLHEEKKGIVNPSSCVFEPSFVDLRVPLLKVSHKLHGL